MLNFSRGLKYQSLMRKSRHHPCMKYFENLSLNSTENGSQLPAYLDHKTATTSDLFFCRLLLDILNTQF